MTNPDRTFKFTDWHWLHHTWTEWSEPKLFLWYSASREQLRHCVVCRKSQRRVVG